ncbi:hypothetical protein TPHA_0C04090 [Tetrapisispora phaffii CBS 4417]|uniref:GST N-terminal domain-containing protein n=1 Tax=Tetrapisispora phaffii (strain ATCC 24235 / CBS 4417 / NBRC 1672 / NRRL Y-8282 / UCD 70-5) TaxID=1071381 RepID=G8BQP7_TETPH|nr:hypothetical protein TPHA_0C04090 [Tetrapisispora phaffii CBS 4417]CCE62559.1 hypothetical protein TPHA_0C04090 [Tetrapisispora phaffii CBS 4417]
MSKQWASKDDGAFKRQVSSFRENICHEHPIYKPAKGRYWLYVSLACPWAHRTLITRALKGLIPIIGVSIVHWHMDEKGWRFLTSEDQEVPFDINKASTINGGIETTNLNEYTPTGHIANDSSRPMIDGTIEPLYIYKRLSDLYYKSNPDYSARFTVPVLWDKETQTIVNNESAEILRMFNSGVFDEFVEDKSSIVVKDLYPTKLQKDIDELNTWIYDNINNGVYKSGFSEKQEVYEKEVTNVFFHLDKVERILHENYKNLETKYGKAEVSKHLDEYFLLNNTLTEVDVRLYTTIVRFDPIYVQHFKCNFTTIRAGYPFIHKWLKNLYWNYDAFGKTTDFNHIKLHYSRSHPRINPLGITPLGPKPDILQMNE